MNLNNTSTVGHRDLELVTINFNGFTACRQVTKRLHHQPTNGIHLFIAEVGAEGFVEIFNWRQRAYRPCMAAELAEVDILFFVVLIFDFADDQLQNIFNCDPVPETPPNSSITIAIW